MNGPRMRSEMAWIGAVLLSNSKDPIECFFWRDPIVCQQMNNIKTHELRRLLHKYMKKFEMIIDLLSQSYLCNGTNATETPPKPKHKTTNDLSLISWNSWP